MPTFPSRLRTNPTDAEKYLWHSLRNRQLAGFKFRRQHPIPPYIVDFVCLERRLIVELDGGQYAEAVIYDASRTVFLEGLGYRVLRFWNNDVLGNMQAVLEETLRELSASPSPRPSPPEGARE